MPFVSHRYLPCGVFTGVLLLSLCCSTVFAGQADEMKLAAPDGWGGETIALPPGFARDMKLVGKEHIRFAPGMMQPKSDSFFSYAFVFELNRKPELTQKVVRQEFLKYYRGLCTAVLNGQAPDVDPTTFTLTLNRPAAAEQKPSTSPGSDSEADSTVRYDAVLKWVEPFRTQKPQTLRMEIHTWVAGERSYVFALVSPREKTDVIWKQLKQIRDDYRNRSVHGQ